MAEPVNLIFYNKVMDRTAIKQLISRLIAHFGITYTTHILDQLKTLGFQQATFGAISLGIDDLLTAPSKSWLIEDAEQYGNLSEKHHNYGSLHAVEKLRQLIETWYATSEYLKQEMNPNFRITDPLNPVHMMSFSGARGSTSQVHQLVGMRGLMSDPQGQIIDLPIQSNFREGLSLTEYIISCYGARKGVVDTAVRTSDAGYLTRRLVEVVQHIVVRKVDCGTLYGINVNNLSEKKKNFQQKLIGRVIAENIYIDHRCIAPRNQDIGALLANRLITLKTKQIFLRSPLTCKSMNWICQLCYGWSLSHGNLIEMGEAVGIIAGQSIGEPGTQLTLRTFHTGGVFTGDIAEHVRTPFNGIISFNENFVYPTRTRHGHPAWMCHTNLFLVIKSKNKVHNFNIPPKSLLLVQNNQYVESKQVIAEIRAKTSPFKEKVQKYIYSNLEGEMHWSTKVRHASEYIHSNIHLILKTCHIWILSGNFHNKNNELSVLFYKNQDKIDFQISLTKEKNEFSFVKNKTQLNLFLFHFYLYKKNKIFIKSQLTNNILNKINNSKNYNFILQEYNIKKNKNFYFLKNKNLTCPLFLKIQKNGVLKNNEIFAILDDPSYKVKNSGILKYGNIKVDLINQNTNFEDPQTKLFRPRYSIVKEGNFFFIPEEVYILTQSLSSVFIKNNKFIQAGTFITSNIRSNTNGLVKIQKKGNNNYELKILPGTIYYPNETYKISKQISLLIPPGKKLFNEFECKNWTYLQWIMPSKEKPFVLIRPAVEYKISKKLNKSTLFDLLKKNKKVEIKTINYLLYEDDEQIQIINEKNIQLIQTCLLVHWKKKYFFKKANVSFLKIKTKNNFRTFLQLSLIKYSNLEKKKEKTISKNVLKKNYYNNFFSKNELKNTKQGVIRTICNQNNGMQSFIILSSSDLVKTFQVKKLTKNISIKTNTSTSTAKFFEFNKNLKILNKKKKLNLTKKNFSIGLLLFKKLGFLGNLHNIVTNSFSSFYLINYTKLISNKYSIINKFQHTCQNPKWYLIDESKKINKLILGKHINYNLFNWCFPLFSLLKKKKDFQTIKLGQLLFENFVISKYKTSFPSGQIISININYFIIRLAKPYLATGGATIHNNYGEFIKEGDTLITLIYERLKSGDIIQGLPKVEQLLEARPINSVSINLINGFEDWNNDMTKFIGNLWGFFLSTKISMEQGQINLVDQIQKVYQSQGVQISNKHIEIIVRQMTSKVITLEDGMTNVFLPGELIEFSRAQKMNRALEEAVPYKPILLGITKASLNTQSFISEASFQETTRVLAKAALKGRIDWLKGLKENVILGGLVPAGTGSQEVIWQITLEKKKEIYLKKKKEFFTKKINNVFLYQDTFSIFPTTEIIHNVLKESISKNNKNNFSI
ncbi:RNA polymerase beta'' subunit (chloroplast) [Marchantia polymorpha subsp. ruderalis]|uniref:DNA-directed RNA polymerase subunit beta'' n=3 Tax=Marchantia polymorpha TaxID=3197 RepID=A0A2Z6DT27_MARPO|nr:RNA polymerase beta'' subunit [Marchantia polymorpha subsp. ruderalis]YP_009646794.1 RNA polymerase beta'' subunit [Marchantia polymorpha]AZU95166.1 RNA polymerase beta'' subunit [Marchantia polymorpha]QBE89550.1 RNA polymerase beta'' subunit [Marchantia polymorpha subsp. ruderalis]BBD75056.1 RNA polymerase beta'' subunit [Marchantia polymorpha subsp. ruderalis]BDD77239.1 RNA polymerase beta'' subunit [Marchantia polymorpha subsp. ruderalis]